MEYRVKNRGIKSFKIGLKRKLRMKNLLRLPMARKRKRHIIIEKFFVKYLVNQDSASFLAIGNQNGRRMEKSKNILIRPHVS